MKVPGPRHHALLQLLKTTESLWNASRVFFNRWNLSPSQFNILNLLSQQKELTQIELSRQLIMHRSNVTGLIDRLEERGLVTRKHHAEDRRSWQVTLSTSGKHLVEEILPHYYAMSEKVWGEMPASKVNQLVVQLEALEIQTEALSKELK